MGRSYGGAPTCEGRPAIDVRTWQRQGLLRSFQSFPYSWSREGEQCFCINVRTEPSAIVLSFCAHDRNSNELKMINQRVPIVWTLCNLGGHRPWFCCSAYSNGRRCGRRVAKVFLGGSPCFACRHCHGLSFASQHEGPRLRSISRSRKIRMRLGGSANVCEPFPEKPRRMHQRTYLRLRARGEAADALCNGFALQWLNGLNWSSSARIDMAFRFF
jgi:hypothetical protein